jgi:acetate kinase
MLGMSGISSDMRTLEASDAPEAKAAIDVFVYRIGRELGPLAAALGGLDAIVVHRGDRREQREACARASARARLARDRTGRRRQRGGGPRIGTAASRTSAWVIPTNEELMIAQHTRISSRDGPPDDRRSDAGAQWRGGAARRDRAQCHPECSPHANRMKDST